jgi:hypothetical protein
MGRPMGTKAALLVAGALAAAAVVVTATVRNTE